MARKEKTIHYLYKTICLVTNRYYIGMHSTCNIDDGYMGSGKRLRYSIRKYGVDNHEKGFIEFFDNRVLLIEAEKEAITQDMISDNNCMNLMSGGTGGFISEEHHQKMKEGSSNWGKLRWLDIEFKKKMAAMSRKRMVGYHKDGKIQYVGYFKNKQHSEETKLLMREKKLGKYDGKNNSQYGTCWITKNGENKKIKNDDLDKWINDGWCKGRIVN